MISKKTEEKDSPETVEPLDQVAFKTILQLIDNSDVKGADAQNILKLKAELARVAGLTK